MINTKTVAKEIDEVKVVGISCDICKKTYDSDDWEEVQEFHHIRFIGGYGSVFGDGCTVSLDVCQYCLKKMIGKYLED